MAYSDYGGYAYKNGERVVERSDAVLTPEGLKATPGQWPGWSLEEGRRGDSYHVILGDDNLYVTIFDQEDYETEKEGWKALLWILPAILFISYIIARIVATVVWGV